MQIRGANLHNLRNVDVTLPRNELVAITGISGSGKSSLAFGTIHGEAQRRYFESVAPFARRLIGSATSPEVEAVEGLPPSVALQQNTSAGGARSTVGTVSTMLNTVRLLYSRTGEYPQDVGHLDSDNFSPNATAGMCPECQGTGITYEPTEASMVPDDSLTINEGAIKAWPGAWAGKNFRDILDTLEVPMDTPWRDLAQELRDWILFTDERPVVTVSPERRADQVEKQYQGTWRSTANYLRETLANTESDTLRKRTISFMESHTCSTCHGRRLHADALRVTYLGMPIDELNALTLAELDGMLSEHTPQSPAEELLYESLTPILRSSIDLGLGHLSLDRPARTLSTGELQRVRLASQLRAGLFGVLYVLDEPSAGLHPVEREAITTLVRRFIEQGNSVILVEHDMELVAGTDWLIDVGPQAGEGGGNILYSGITDDYATSDADTPTARALAHRKLQLNDSAPEASASLELHGINARTLKDVDVTIGLGQMTAVVGVSGSGKTTLLKVIADVLRAQTKNLDEDELASRTGAVSEVRGDDNVDRLVPITQKPIGRTPRSCVATYTGLFDRVRKLFAKTDEAKRRKWNVSRFSYNVKQGQCPTCGGAGQIEVELVFLPGSYVTCPDCQGGRYNPETLEVTWNGYTVADVLGLTVAEAVDVFAEDASISRALRALNAVGLGYLRLGQGAPELSGGEAQRIKLATELQRARRGHTLYLLDEPTTGLHPHDAQLLMRELRRLVDEGDTVIFVEHDMNAVAGADRVIELGPGAGVDGGRIVADDTPARLAEQDTPTAQVLAARA
ncbi:excinuclease ABC subunit A [Corynebacterium yudongzhengii]|uniref:UvrABC system protein A n=1 Tax=Corynebacterium yudongzhengii TaxID=2080740 RepID=A0A2U1TA02_9CORY|nr:excinuclease ABC subunit A [Corynebacterium yudongzhengii]PWC02837.1 excinuclease ABC subunit UvrA [Corynebacterium yudongzhengii]